MFGFSLSKLILTAIIVYVVWQGFKYLQRRQELDAQLEREKVRAARRESQGSSDPVEDMVRCKVCDSFVPSKGTRSCGRTDCPYPG